MNRILVIFFLLTAIVQTSDGQSVDLRAGVNFTTVTGEPGHSLRTRYYFGVGKDITMLKLLSFRPEIYYSHQGSNGPRNTQLSFHYFQMPLYFNYSFGKTGVLLGPQLGMLIGANYKDDRGERFPILPAMNKFDLLLGTGVYYHVMEQLKVETRVVFGVTPFDNFDTEALRNVMISAGVSWTIKNLSPE